MANIHEMYGKLAERAEGMAEQYQALLENYRRTIALLGDVQGGKTPIEDVKIDPNGLGWRIEKSEQDLPVRNGEMVLSQGV